MSRFTINRSSPRETLIRRSWTWLAGVVLQAVVMLLVVVPLLVWFSFSWLIALFVLFMLGVASFTWVRDLVRFQPLTIDHERRELRRRGSRVAGLADLQEVWVRRERRGSGRNRHYVYAVSLLLASGAQLAVAESRVYEEMLPLAEELADPAGATIHLGW